MSIIFWKGRTSDQHGCIAVTTAKEAHNFGTCFGGRQVLENQLQNTEIRGIPPNFWGVVWSDYVYQVLAN